MPSDGDRPRVLLLGVGPTAESALKGLSGTFDVVGLVRPDGPPDDPAQMFAAEHGIEVLTKAGLADVAHLVRSRAPDCVVCSSYDRVLPADVLSLCPFVNVHYSPLPRYRGRANVNWAIINGEPDAAISVHTLVPGLDAGGILAQKIVPIGDRDTVGDLYAKLNARQEQLLAGAVTRRLLGDEGTPQDESAATYGCTRTPDDGEVDWGASTGAIDRLVRALGDPYPPAFTFLGLRRVDVLRAEPMPDVPPYDGRIPGRVVRVGRDNGFVDVLTGDGVLRLWSLAVDGAGPVPASQVVRSVKDTLGLRTIDLLRRLTALSDAMPSPLAEPPAS